MAALAAPAAPTAADSFVALYVDAWATEANKANGADGKYPGQIGCESAARKLWRKVPQSNDFEVALRGRVRVFERIRTRRSDIEAALTAIPTPGKVNHLQTEMNHREHLLKDLRDHNDYLRTIRQGLDGVSGATTDRTRRMIVRIIGESDDELAAWTPHLPQLKDNLDRISALDDQAPLKSTQDWLDRNLKALTRRAEIWQEVASSLSNLAVAVQGPPGQHIQRVNDVVRLLQERSNSACTSLAKLLHHLKIIAEAEPERRILMDQKGDEPDEDNHAAVRTYIAKVQKLNEVNRRVSVAADALRNTKDLQIDPIQSMLSRVYEDRRRKWQSGREEITKLQDRSRLEGDPETPWIATPEVHGGGHGQVAIWIKRDADENIIDRVAVKDTINGNSHQVYPVRDELGVWLPPDDDDDVPMEVVAMYKLRPLRGSEAVVRIRNWRNKYATEARGTKRKTGQEEDGNEDEDEDEDEEEEEEEPGGYRTFRLFVEYCGHGDLWMLRGRQRNHHHEPPEQHLPEPFLWAVLEHLSDVGLLMEHGDLEPGQKSLWDEMVHGDMKANNVFLGERSRDKFPEYPMVKLGDFGRATIFPDGIGENQWVEFGTPGTRAPEMAHNDQGHDLLPPSAANVWGVGFIVRELLHSRPYDGLWIQGGRPTKPPRISQAIKSQYTPTLMKLVEKCLRVDPDQRPTFADIKKTVRERTGEKAKDDAVDMLQGRMAGELPAEYKLETQTDRYAFGFGVPREGMELVGGPTGTHMDELESSDDEPNLPGPAGDVEMSDPPEPNSPVPAGGDSNLVDSSVDVEMSEKEDDDEEEEEEEEEEERIQPEFSSEGE